MTPQHPRFSRQEAGGVFAFKASGAPQNMSYSVETNSVTGGMQHQNQTTKMRDLSAHNEKLVNGLLQRNQDRLIEKSDIMSENGEYEPE